MKSPNEMAKLDSAVRSAAFKAAAATCLEVSRNIGRQVRFRPLGPYDWQIYDTETGEVLGIGPNFEELIRTVSVMEQLPGEIDSAFEV